MQPGWCALIYLFGFLHLTYIFCLIVQQQICNVEGRKSFEIIYYSVILFTFEQGCVNYWEAVESCCRSE